MSTECLHPPASVLVKLGSLIVHLENNTIWSRQSASELLEDREVQEWLLAMEKLHLLPVSIRRG